MGKSKKEKVKFTLTHRQRLILPVVMIGAFFEGFDFMVISLALPFISKEYQLNATSSSMIVSIVAIGALLAFFVVRMADRVGRKPVFLWAIIIYSILSLGTAFAPNVEIFVACQFIARVFLVTSWALGFIIMTEEFDNELRGRAVGLFQSAAAVGAIFPSLLLPLVSQTSLHWRGLYIIGALPLILIIIWGKNLQETPRFLEMKAGMGEEDAKPPLTAVFSPQFRKYIFAIMALWFFMYLCYASSMNFFSYRVVNELGWTAGQIGPVMAMAYTLGLLGYVAVGKLLDTLGRKKTAFLFFGLGSLAVIATFQATSYYQVMISQIIGVFFAGTFTVLCATFTNELFPTSIRANATAWGNNIIGRIGTIAAPALVGIMQVPLHGTGNAVSVLALAPFVCIAIIAIFLPETLGYECPEYVAPGKRNGAYI